MGPVPGVVGWGLFGLGDDADVGLGGAPGAEDLAGFVVADRAGDDDVLAGLPVDRGGDAVGGGELEGVDDPQHLVEVAAGGHRVDQDQLDLLVRADDEHVADGLVVGGGAGLGVAGGGGRQHVIQLGDVEVIVGDDRVVGGGALGLGDVGGP